jgi:hypothetical protein
MKEGLLTKKITLDDFFLKNQAIFMKEIKEMEERK